MLASEEFVPLDFKIRRILLPIRTQSLASPSPLFFNVFFKGSRTSDNLDLGNTVAVTEDNTDLGGSGTLLGQLADVVHDLVGGDLEPCRGGAGVGDGRGGNALALAVKATHFCWWCGGPKGCRGAGRMVGREDRNVAGENLVSGCVWVTWVNGQVTPSLILLREKLISFLLFGFTSTSILLLANPSTRSVPTFYFTSPSLMMILLFYFFWYLLCQGACLRTGLR